MDEKSAERFPEIVVSTNKTTKRVSAAAAKGDLRKIGPRLYTSNLKDDPTAIIRRNIWQIVAGYCPKGIIADRTALEGRPSDDGYVFVIADRARDVDLPGLKIRPRRGHGPVEGDRPFIADLVFSSRARAFLENLRPSRARRGAPRTLSIAQIEEALERDLARGSGALNKIRDQARAIAPALGREEEMKKLDGIVGTLLGTKDVPLTSAKVATRAKGQPYDARRLELLTQLHAALVGTAPIIRASRNTTPAALTNLCFFEAYFSNFIEGTEFPLEEARNIVFKRMVPRERPEDAHDVLGTFDVVSNSQEMTRPLKTAEDFINAMKERHATIMAAHPDKTPGAFKDRLNRVGGMVFVAPDLVEGTLVRGFELYRSLEVPFARAVFLMFLISEVHPFLDGNGRIGRIMMNAELVTANEQRIIIPTIYRNNYLSALRALSNSGTTDPLIRVLDFAQNYTGAIPFDSFEVANKVLARTNALVDSNEAEEKGIRLKIPTPDLIHEAEQLTVVEKAANNA